MEAKVGDKIYLKKRGRITDIYEVVRVSKTQCYIKLHAGYEKPLKFEGEHLPYKLHEVPRPEYYNATGDFILEHDEIKLEYEKQLVLDQIKEAYWDKMSIDKLREILAIIDSTPRNQSLK